LRLPGRRAGRDELGEQAFALHEVELVARVALFVRGAPHLVGERRKVGLQEVGLFLNGHFVDQIHDVSVLFGRVAAAHEIHVAERLAPANHQVLAVVDVDDAVAGDGDGAILVRVVAVAAIVAPAHLASIPY